MASDVRIVILQRGSEILKGAASPQIRVTAAAALETRSAPVEILLDAAVKSIQPGVIEFERNGQLEKVFAETIVWTAGNAIHPLVQSLPISAEHRDKSRRLQVSPTLQLPNFPEVFAAGDCAIDPHNPQPLTAQVAYQQGAAIAHNLKALLDDKAPNPAKVRLRGTLIKLGLNASAAEIFDRFEIKGEAGHLIRQGAYLELLPTPIHNFKATTEWLTDEMFQRLAGK